VFSSLANWHALRSHHYRSPIVKGMWRGEVVKRDRVLNDDELRAVWKQAETGASFSDQTFGALIRFALLTAQRKEKLVSIKWDHVKDGVWTIETEEGEKGNAGVVELPEAALAIIEQRKALQSDSPYIFAAQTSGGRFNCFPDCKRAFDAAVPIAPWRLHDLRRTARSLLSRAGVRPDISERVLGHVQQGVQGIYDCHDYVTEKADALKRLAQQIMDIVTPPPSNVRRLRA
jgi:integrase